MERYQEPVRGQRYNNWMKQTAKMLEPWRHDIDLGPFSTFDIADSVGPFRSINHPKPRAKRILNDIPPEENSILDLGCNAGGISFFLEQNGDWDITGVENNMDKEVSIHPLHQAWFCKYVRDSDVKFLEYDVMDFLSLGVSYDVIIAAGLLYHIRSNGNRNTQAEHDFIDLLIKSSDNRFIIETDSTDWLEDYIEPRVSEIVIHNNRGSTPKGVREYLVAIS